MKEFIIINAMLPNQTAKRVDFIQFDNFRLLKNRIIGWSSRFLINYSVSYSNSIDNCGALVTHSPELTHVVLSDGSYLIALDSVPDFDRKMGEQ